MRKNPHYLCSREFCPASTARNKVYLTVVKSADKFGYGTNAEILCLFKKAARMIE